ncbi:integrase [Herbaspirillum sp. meg3]|uniref:tyrosine-type recombinase/integrase n=1 Tax=Herbaspirillum sp. meg3 TaxID=2025949 RepID=UPI000B98F4D0|nr:site-specific integrase [Herbaspirillum sp. meg3]ASU38523.1 integrase [Herbaspirillum sp. meg3]
MAGAINKLTDTKIEKSVKAAKLASSQSKGKASIVGDGGGLYLQISKTGAASWLFRYMRDRKAVGLGLGAYPDVSLKNARVKADACRTQLAEDRDPLTEKRASQTAAKEPVQKAKTFDECAAEYIADHRAEWKNAKHAQQWENTLAMYASPVIGDKAVDAITLVDIKKILAPIWTRKYETASRLRGRIESVLGWATVHELRTGDNPARWKGHLEHLLAKSSLTLRAVKHHAALPYADIPAFIRALSQQEGMARWALEFLILTACRTSEICQAKWSEIDLKKGLWTIPEERMKAGKEHRVPLSDRALTVLHSVKPLAIGEFIFPGGVKDKHLSNMAMMMLLRRMGHDKITVHGFRSTFRDWIGETTQHEFQVAEAALAHGLADKVVAAYARGDLYEKRYALMQDWSNYCWPAEKSKAIVV